MARCSSSYSAIAASACKLVFWGEAQNLQKPARDPWTVILCTQIVQCLSLTSACFLYLKPFLESVESGFMRADDIRRRGTDDYYMHTSGGSSTMRSAFSIRKHTNTGSQSIGLGAMPSPHNTTTITANESADMDAESQHSRAQIIKETRTFAVKDSTNES